MKTKKACPKCGSRDIVIIPGSVGASGAGNNVSTGWTVFSSVKVTRYLCSGCGFIEEWIDNPEDLEKIKQKYSESKPKKAKLSPIPYSLP